jgi:hypothetical protein
MRWLYWSSTLVAAVAPPSAHVLWWATPLLLPAVVLVIVLLVVLLIILLIAVLLVLLNVSVDSDCTMVCPADCIADCTADPEILERRYPVVLRQFRLRPGSGGKGRWCGGDGVVREVSRRTAAVPQLFRSSMQQAYPCSTLHLYHSGTLQPYCRLAESMASKP